MDKKGIQDYSLQVEQEYDMEYDQVNQQQLSEEYQAPQMEQGEDNNIEEEALQRMQILANMSNLENMDEQQLYEHYEFLKKHGYINDEDINQRPGGANVDEHIQQEIQPDNQYYDQSQKHQFNNSL